MVHSLASMYLHLIPLASLLEVIARIAAMTPAIPKRE
jgi:hypothetical protein